MKLVLITLLVLAAVEAAEVDKVAGIMRKWLTKSVNTNSEWQAAKIDEKPKIDSDVLQPELQAALAEVTQGAVSDSGRIVGGSTASRGQFPWHASIILDSYTYCGGSLISSNSILTAAHCAHGIGTFSIRLGATSLQTPQTGSISVVTRSKIIHSGYNANTMRNDIALLRLGTNVPSSAYVKPIRLPRASQTGDFFVGYPVVACGFKLPGSTTAQTSLRYSSLTVISNAACAEYYGASITPSNICAIDPDSANACIGDSGGALAAKEEDGEYNQIGFMAYFHGNCKAEYPSVYTRVTSYLSWISVNAGIAVEP